MNLCTGANQDWGSDIVINLDNAIYAFRSANTGINVRANMIHRVNDAQSDAYKTLASAYSNGNVPFHNFYELEGAGSEYKGFDAQYTFDVTGHLNENEDVYIYNWNPNTKKFCWTDTFRTNPWYDSTGNKRVVTWPMAGVDCLRLAVTEMLPDEICEENYNGGNESGYNCYIDDKWFSQSISIDLSVCQNNADINQRILAVLDEGIAHYSTTQDKQDRESIVSDGRATYLNFYSYSGNDEIEIEKETIKAIFTKLSLGQGSNTDRPDLGINFNGTSYFFSNSDADVDVREFLIHEDNNTDSNAYKTFTSVYDAGNLPVFTFYAMNGVGNEYKGFDANYIFDVTGKMQENQMMYTYCWNENAGKFMRMGSTSTNKNFNYKGEECITAWGGASTDGLYLLTSKELPDDILLGNNGGDGDWKSSNLTVDVSSVVDSAGLNAAILNAVQTTDIPLADLNQLWIHFSSNSSLDLSSYTISESTIKTLVTAIDGDETIENYSNNKSVAIVYRRNNYVFWTKDAARDVNFKSYIEKTTDSTISDTITGAFGDHPIPEYDLYEMSGAANRGEYKGFEYREEMDCALNQENSDVNLYYWDENAKMFEYWGNTKTNYPTYFVNGIQDGKYVAVYGTLPESIVKSDVGDPGLGDVNGDDAVTAADALCILKHLAGIHMDCFFDEVADTNLDGSVTAADALAVLKHLAGIENIPGYENVEGN